MNIQKTFNTILTSPNKHLKITLVLDICTNIKEYDLLSILKFLYKLVLKDTDLATRIFHSLVSSKIIKYKMTNCKFEYKLKRIVLGSTGKEYKNEKIDFKSQKKEITKAVNIDERFVAVDFINEKDLDVNEKCMKQVVIGERNVQSVDDFFDFLCSDMISSEYVRREGAFKMINCFFVNEEIDDNYYKIIFEEEKKDDNKDDSKEKSLSENENKDITEKSTMVQRKVSTSQTIKTENVTVKNITRETVSQTQENTTLETINQTQETVSQIRETVSQTQEIITKETSTKETYTQETQNDITQVTEFLVDYTWEVPENILTVILQVIYSDKLTDFVSDQISFPVREHAITLLKHLYAKNTHTYIKNVLLNFINCDDWQVQVGALMAIQRLDLHIDSDLLIRLLSSEVDDVRFFALECMKNHVISDPLVLKVCWDLIDDGNESTIGKKSVFMLLKKIYEHKRIDGEKNNVLEPVTSIKQIERHGNSKEQTSIDFCSYNQVETGILSVSLLEEGVIETYRLVLYFRSYLSDIRLAVLDFVESVSDRLDDIQMLIRLLVENVLLDDNSTVIERSMCILKKVIHSIDTNTMSIVVKTITDTNLHYNKDYFITTADELVFNESGARLVGVNEILNGKVRILTVLWYYMNNNSEDMVNETEKIVSCKGLISYILYGMVQVVKGKDVEQRADEYFISMLPTVYHKEIALCMKGNTTKTDKSMKGDRSDSVSANATKTDGMTNDGMDIDADKLYVKNKYANHNKSVNAPSSKSVNAPSSKSVNAPNNNASNTKSTINASTIYANNANDSMSINASAVNASNTYISKLPIVNSIIQDITRMKAFYMGDHLIQFYTTETHTLLIDLLSQVLHTLTDRSTVHQLYTAMIKENVKVKEETKPINTGVLGKLGIHDVSDISIAEEETHIDLFFKHYKYDSDFKQHIAKDDSRLIFIGSTIDYITDLQEYDFIFYESIDYIYNNTTSIDDRETKTYFTCCFNTIKRYIKHSHTYLSYTINRFIENLHPYFLYNIIDDIDFSYYFLFMKRLLVQMNRSNDKYAIKVFSHIVPYLGMKKVSINTTHMHDILVSMHDIYNFYSTDNISIMDIPDLTLGPYQIYGVKWMSFLCYYGINGILADDMGLGKTIMVLSFLANEICSILHKKRKSIKDTNYTKDTNANDTYNSKDKTDTTNNTYNEDINDNTNNIANNDNTNESLSINNKDKTGTAYTNNSMHIPSMLDDKFTLSVEEKNIYIKNIPVEKCQQLYTYNLSEIGNDLWKSLSILIITPISLTSHWQDEIKAKYNNYLRSVIYTKKDPKYDLITITSFETYRSDYEDLSKRTYFYVIVDEGHILRNRDTQLYKRILALKSKHKLVLTGTPIHNSVDDVFSLFNFLMPNYLGTEREFNKKYGLLLKKIDAGKKPSTSDFDKMSNLLNSLKSLVTPFCLRRLKKDVLKDLPPKVINDIVVELDEEDTAIYNLFECDDGDYSKGFGRVGDLLKICSHKTYVRQILSKYESEKGMIVEQEKLRLTDAKRRKTENGDTSKSSRSAQTESDDLSVSPKIKALVDIIDQCGGKEISHKIIVFFQYKQTIDYVLKDITNLCPYLKCLRLDGTTKNRAKVVNDFQALDYNMLFITTSVGGLGLNLTSADVVVFYEYDWNPFNDLQAMDRAHRIGQKNVVNVYRLICKGTIEERKMNVQAFKVFVAERIIDDKCEEKGMDVIEKFVK